MTFLLREELQKWRHLVRAFVLHVKVWCSGVQIPATTDLSHKNR